MDETIKPSKKSASLTSRFSESEISQNYTTSTQAKKAYVNVFKIRFFAWYKHRILRCAFMFVSILTYFEFDLNIKIGLSYPNKTNRVEYAIKNFWPKLSYAFLIWDGSAVMTAGDHYPRHSLLKRIFAPDFSGLFALLGPM